jgi:hypothetical protein
MARIEGLLKCTSGAGASGEHVRAARAGAESIKGEVDSAEGRSDHWACQRVGRSEDANPHRTEARRAERQSRTGAAVLADRERHPRAARPPGLGAKEVDRLARDLRTALPDMKGLSPRKPKCMRASAQAWPGAAFVQEVIAHSH